MHQRSASQKKRVKSSPSSALSNAGKRKLPNGDLKSQPLSKRSRTGQTRRKYVNSVETEARAINSAPQNVLALFVFGSGDCGELGLGPSVTEALKPLMNPYFDPDEPSKFHVVQLHCGGMHTVALTDRNRIVTWGVNDNGALGRHTQWDGVQRDINEDSGDEGDGDLNPLESTPTALPRNSFTPGTNFVQVVAGDSCSFALTDTGLVYGWGAFVDNQGNARFGYDVDGILIEKQTTPKLISGLKEITQLSCGANHALALDTTGRVWGWGSSGQNQLGRRLFGRHQEDLIPRLVEVCRGKAKYIASGEYHSFAIDHKDNVWAWGLNSFGEAGYAKDAGGDSALLPYPMKIRDLSGKGVTKLDGGAHHSVAVTANGDCLAWGRIDGGQLGLDLTTQQLQDETVVRYDDRQKPRICLRPTAVSGINKKFIHAACGTDHTLFIDEDGQGYSTGLGSVGQLGLGSEDDVEFPERLRGKELKARQLGWAGAGGQFSIVAAPAHLSRPL